MTFVQSWEDVRAPRRGDNVPWTHVLVEESLSASGPWTQIDALPWTDPTPDTVAPTLVTTALATLEVGWFRLRWQDGNGVKSPATDPVLMDGSTVVPWRPTLGDVAALIPEYTRGRLLDAGVNAGRVRYEFGADTTPPASAVAGFISAACETVAGRVGAGDVRLDDYADLARQTAAWYAVLLICRDSASGRLADEDGALQTATREYVGNLTELQSQLRRVAPGVV